MLAGGIRPGGGVQSVEVAGDRPALDFQNMLEQAAGGKLETGLPIRAPEGLTPPVEPDQHGSLSRSTDRAEQEGIERALVDLGERTFRIDVRNRAIIDAPDAQLRAVGGIDGYVRAGSGAAGETDPMAASGPARVVRNVSLLDALARVRPDVS